MKQSKTKRSIGAKNRTRGHSYERKIVKELRELTKNENIKSSRSESRTLDDMKIDVADIDNILPCYFQLKATQNVPGIKSINDEVGKKDKPLCILWAAQETRDIKQICVGEYAIIPKQFFYELLKLYFNGNE